MEENLTLEELFTLYKASINEVQMDMKIAAAVQGADVDFDDDWYESQTQSVNKDISETITSLPFGLSYESA